MPQSGHPESLLSDTEQLAPTWRSSLIVIVVCAILLAPTLSFRIGVDQGVFAYMGAELLDGRWPYLQTWESDYPGIVFLHAAEILVFGKSIVGFRVFDLLYQLVNAYLIYRIAARIATVPAGILGAGMFCLIYQGWGPWNTGQREGFGMLFILLGYWLYLTAQRRPPLVTALLIGLGLGVAVTLKPTLLALAVGYLPLLLRWDRRSWTLLGAAVLGAVAPAATIVLIYWMKGGLTQMYEACIAYQSIYTARLRGDEPLLISWLTNLPRLGANAWGISLLYPMFLAWGPSRHERWMLYLAYLGSVFALLVQGTFAGYHYLPGLAIGSVLIGTMFSQLFGLGSNRVMGFTASRSRHYEMLVAALLVLALVPIYWKAKSLRNLVTLQFLSRPAPGEFRNKTVFDFTEDYDVAEYLREHTQPGDAIQIWGYESLVYFLADRDAASRFQMTHPLVMRVPGEPLSPMQQRWRYEFLRDVRTRQPVYVAVVQQDNWWWAPQEQTSEELLDDFPDWKAFIASHYQFEQRIGRFLLYRMTSEPQLLHSRGLSGTKEPQVAIAQGTMYDTSR